MSRSVKPATQSKASNPSVSLANSAWSEGPPQTTAASNSSHAQPPASNARPGTHARRQSTLGPNAGQGAAKPVTIGRGVTGPGYRPTDSISFGSVDVTPVLAAPAPPIPIAEARRPRSIPVAPLPFIAAPQPSAPTLAPAATPAQPPVQAPEPPPAPAKANNVKVVAAAPTQPAPASNTLATTTPSAASTLSASTSTPGQREALTLRALFATFGLTLAPPVVVPQAPAPSAPTGPNVPHGPGYAGLDAVPLPKSPQIQRAPLVGTQGGSGGPRPAGSPRMGSVSMPLPHHQQHHPQHALHMQPQSGQQPYYYPPQGFDPYMHYWRQQHHLAHPHQHQHMHNPPMQPSPPLPSAQPRPPSTPPVSSTPPHPPALGHAPPPISTHVHNPTTPSVPPPATGSQPHTAAVAFVPGSSMIRPRASTRISTPDGSALPFEGAVPPSPKVSIKMGQGGGLSVSRPKRQPVTVRVESADEKNARLAKEKEEKEKKEREEREKKEEKERLEREAKERAEREEHERIEREAREKEEQERKAREENERLEREEKERVEREKAEAEAKAKAEEVARLKAEAEAEAAAKAKAEAEEQARAEAEAKVKAEAEAAAAEARDTVPPVESPKLTSNGLLPSTIPERPSPLLIPTTASERPKRPVPGPLDLSSAQGNRSPAPPSVLASARIIEEVIKMPNPDLNIAATSGKLRYDREFPPQFMNVYKEKPDSLPLLEAIGLEPSEQSAASYPGGARQGGRLVGSVGTSDAPGIQRQGSIRLGLGNVSLSKGGVSMGGFQATPSRFEGSQSRLEASTAAGRGGAGIPFPPGTTGQLTPMTHSTPVTAEGEANIAIKSMTEAMAEAETKRATKRFNTPLSNRESHLAPTYSELSTSMADLGQNNLMQHRVHDQAADGMDAVGSTAAAISEYAAEQKAEECIQTCLSTGNTGQVINIFQKLSDDYRTMLVEKSIAAAFDGGSESVAVIAKLFAAAYAQRICTPKLFERGFLLSVQSADDTSIDLPRTYEWLAKLLHAAGLTKARVERMAERIMVTGEPRLQPKYLLVYEFEKLMADHSH